MQTILPIAIGADDAALDFKNQIIRHLTEQGHTVIDYSSDILPDNSMYPDVAYSVAKAIKAGQHVRGILICGTGIGMSIVANKVLGIRAAQCHDTFSAERARKSNDAQIMTMGARVIGVELAKLIVEAWLTSEFEGGGSTPKVDKIKLYEQDMCKDQ